MLHSDGRRLFRRLLVLLAMSGTMGIISGACNPIELPPLPWDKVPVYGLPADEVADPSVVPDEYIVVLPRQTTATQRLDVERRARDIGAALLTSYDFPSLQGFAAKMAPEVLEQMRLFSDIAWIEVNRLGERTGIQTCAPWNLDVLDQQSEVTGTLVQDEVYSYAATGNKVNVLVVDTGLRLGTGDFAMEIDGASWFPKMCDSNDDDGHGTMVAEVVGGKAYGVAKGVTVIGYNVGRRSCNKLNNNQDICDPKPGCTQCAPECYDHLLEICKPSCVPSCPGAPPQSKYDIAALQDIAKKIDTLPKPLVVVFPHAHPKLLMPGALEDAVDKIVAGGAIFITGAGNGKEDACSVSPALKSVGSEKIITVGGLSEDGSVGQFNSGSCVDLFAPGADIATVRPSGTCGAEGIVRASGTSFAAAHVAGLAALLLEKKDGDPVGFKQSLLSNATRQIELHDGLAGSPNLVLHNRYNIGESATPDADGKEDKVTCFGPDCIKPMCVPFDGPNPCNEMSSDACKLRVRCTGEECARCGRHGDLCCESGDACDSGTCGLDGHCLGKCQVDCCDGTTLRSDGEKIDNISEENVCKLFGGLSCKGHGGGPERIAYAGNIIWSKSTNECPTMLPCIATCVDGSKDYVGQHFDEGMCNISALSSACGGKEKVVGAELVHPQGCGNANEECCVAGAQTYCLGDELKCNGGKCEECGLPGQACCKDKSCRGGMTCYEGTCEGRCTVRCTKGELYVSPDGTNFQTKNECILWAQDTCNVVEGSNSARVRYNSEYVYNLDSYFPETCGAKNRYCCFSPEDFDGDGSGDKCDDAGWQCLSIDPQSDGDPGNDGAVGIQRCAKTTIGDPNNPCHADGEPCNTPDMACVGGICRAWCRVRCWDGHYIATGTEALTKNACVAWGESQCNARGFGDHQSVFFNGVSLWNREAVYPGTCGNTDLNCCHAWNGTDCKDPLANCLVFPLGNPPEDALDYQICSTCGAPNQPCCDPAKKNGSVCAMETRCVANTCQACGGSTQPCCPLPQEACKDGKSCVSDVCTP